MTKEELIDLISRIKDIAKEEVSHDSKFVDDIGLSSIQLVSLVVLCENELDIDLLSDPTLFSKISSVGEALDFINSK